MNGISLMRQSRSICEAMGAKPGAYTPIVLERYAFIGGERGIRLGRPTTTTSGTPCIAWTNKPAA